MMEEFDPLLDSNLKDSKLREKIRVSENTRSKVESMQTELKKLTQAFHGYQQAAQMMEKATQSIAFSIRTLGQFDSATRSNSYNTLASTLLNIDNVRRKQVDEHIGEIVQSLEMFTSWSSLKDETSVYIPDLAKEMDQAVSTYDTSLRKINKRILHHESDHSKMADENEASEAQDKLSEVTKQYLYHVLEAEESTCQCLLEKLCAFMLSTSNHYVQAYSVSKNIQPVVDNLLSDLHNVFASGKKQDHNLQQRDRRISFQVEENMFSNKEKQGYLLKKSPKGWLLRWFQITFDGTLSWHKSWKTITPAGFLNLSECRVNFDDASGLSFTIYSNGSTRRSLTIKASSVSESSAWSHIITTYIDKSPSSHLPPSSLSSFSGSSDGFEEISFGSPPKHKKGTNDAIAPRRRASFCNSVMLDQSSVIDVSRFCIQRNETNRYCADCNSEFPTWACCNIGVVVCEGCATIHRKLGRKISKLKSLKNDHWDIDELKIVLDIGNKANNFLEYMLPFDLEKPSPKSSFDHKEDWIRRKYERKEFVPMLGLDEGTVYQELHQAVLNNDGTSILQLLSFGVDVNCVNDVDGQKSLIHYAVTSDNTFVAEILVQNDVELNSADYRGLTPLHYCVMFSSENCAALLLKRGARPYIRDASGRTPEDIARDEGADWFVDLLYPSGSSTSSAKLSFLSQLESLGFDDSEPITLELPKPSTSTSSSASSSTSSSPTASSSNVPSLSAILGNGSKTVTVETTRPRKGSRFAIRLSPNTAINLEQLDKQDGASDQGQMETLRLKSNWRDTRKLNASQLAHAFGTISSSSSSSSKGQVDSNDFSSPQTPPRFRAATTGSVVSPSRDSGSHERDTPPSPRKEEPKQQEEEQQEEDASSGYSGGFSRSSEWREIIRSKLAKNI